MEVYKVTTDDIKEIVVKKRENLPEEAADKIFFLLLELESASADDDELYFLDFVLIKSEEELRILEEVLALSELNVKIEIVSEQVLSGYFLDYEEKYTAVADMFYKFKYEKTTIDEILDQINIKGIENLDPVYKKVLSDKF